MSAAVDRRSFLAGAAGSLAMAASASGDRASAGPAPSGGGMSASPTGPIRLGAPVWLDSEDPEERARAHRAKGYRAGYCPDIALDDRGVTFRVKDYRRNGPARYTTMTLDPHEFIRRFLIHTLPKGLHRIRHYGLFASGVKADNLARMRQLLGAEGTHVGDAEGHDDASSSDDTSAQPCPCCGAVMRIIEVFEAGSATRHRAMPEGIDSS